MTQDRESRSCLKKEIESARYDIVGEIVNFSWYFGNLSMRSNIAMRSKLLRMHSRGASMQRLDRHHHGLD